MRGKEGRRAAAHDGARQRREGGEGPHLRVRVCKCRLRLFGSRRRSRLAARGSSGLLRRRGLGSSRCLASGRGLPGPHSRFSHRRLSLRTQLREAVIGVIAGWEGSVGMLRVGQHRCAPHLLCSEGEDRSRRHIASHAHGVLARVAVDLGLEVVVDVAREVGEVDADKAGGQAREGQHGGGPGSGRGGGRPCSRNLSGQRQAGEWLLRGKDSVDAFGACQDGCGSGNRGCDDAHAAVTLPVVAAVQPAQHRAEKARLSATERRPWVRCDCPRSA